MELFTLLLAHLRSNVIINRSSGEERLLAAAVKNTCLPSNSDNAIARYSYEIGLLYYIFTI